MTVTVLHQAKFEVPTGMSALDEFEAPEGAIPPDTFIVTRGRDSLPVSYYGDLIWDFTAYTADGRQLWLSFAYWGSTPPSAEQQARCAEGKGVIFALIWLREGANLAPRTVVNYLTVVCALCAHAEKHGVTLAALLSDRLALMTFARTECSGWMAETLGSLLGNLVKLGAEQLGLELVSGSVIVELKKKNKAYRSTIKQHPPMPTAIYSHFIQGLQGELDAWLHAAGEVLPALAACGADRRMGRTILQQLVICKKWRLEYENHPTFDQIATTGCIQYLECCGKQPHVKGLSYVVGEAQVVMKLLVQTFTGMRDDEAASLPYNCIEKLVKNGKTHYIVNGHTTKLNSGLIKRTKWVTNHDGYRAIMAARAIADTIYSVFGTRPRDTGRITQFPLFVSVGYMNLASSPMEPKDSHFLAGQMSIRADSRLNTLLSAVIKDADLCELEKVDPHRAWRSEDVFKVGLRWSFTTHQLRRSLALYAQRSGLVSLPSLRRQLQHITEEMSRYYARGSAYAEDFIGDYKEHFGRDWQATQPESAGLSYILNVLMTGDKLFGGHAHWVKHRLKSPEGTILIDRETTMRRFKKGEMAYRETSLGGCANTTTCDKTAVNWLDVECIRDNCKNLVCNVPKLERVIAAQQRMVSSLDLESVEYRTEKADLDVLTAARDAAQMT